MTEASPHVDTKLTALVADWLEDIRHRRRLSEHSCNAYQRDLFQLFAFLASHNEIERLSVTDFTDMHVRDLRAFMSSRRSDGAQNRSLARGLSGLRSFDRFLRQADYPATQALENIQSPKLAHNLPRPVEAQSVFDMISLAIESARKPWEGLRDAALLTLLYGCGLRISEALQLSVGDFEITKQRKTLRVIGKGSKPRDVPFLDMIVGTIDTYLAALPYNTNAEDPLFRASRGGALSARQAQLTMLHLRRSLNLPESVTPHALRHSFASHLLNAGGDLRTIQDLLGHAQLSSTQIYTELDGAHLQKVYAAAHPRARKLD